MDGVSLKARAYTCLSIHCIDFTRTLQGLYYDWYLFYAKLKYLDISWNY